MRAILTIHGFLTDIDDFSTLNDMLHEEYDHVEHCKVPGHNDEVDYALFVADDTVNCVVDTYDGLCQQYDTVDVMGYSMGGALATHLCSIRDVHKCVLVAPSNKYINVTSMFKILTFMYKQYYTAYKESQGKWSHKLKQAQDWMNSYVNDGKMTFAVGLNNFAKNLRPRTYSTFRKLMSTCNDSLESKQIIDTPCLIVWGELDELVPHKSVLHITKYFANAKLKTYHGCGHLLLKTSRSQYVIRDIGQFLLQDNSIR